jgi:putative component of toxin-antitoxin plasmid stabilization module
MNSEIDLSPTEKGVSMIRVDFGPISETVYIQV